MVLRPGRSGSGSAGDVLWWFRGWKKARNWSEKVAGPKWMTFIRRNRAANGGGSQFRYDPLSYAMNFDEGNNNDSLDDGDSLWRDFSSRHASLPTSCKGVNCYLYDKLQGA
ncbi:hypothetical protein SAY86_015472 [Trapa natans]|uniref:Uncharacterized protein n=1 Tax=Trapa natans TaxID=22666 RepID=A0AAN7QYZ5_TRANT|nr:hypothetical protein SAY86_015472 [Trapa natans]